MPVSLAAHSGAQKSLRGVYPPLRTTSHAAVVCTASANASHRALGQLGLPHVLKGTDRTAIFNMLFTKSCVFVFYLRHTTQNS